MDLKNAPPFYTFLCFKLMNMFVPVVSLNFDFLSYECHYEKEKKKVTRKRMNKSDQHWSSPVDWHLMKKRGSWILILIPHIPQLVWFEQNVSIVQSFFSYESIHTLVIFWNFHCFYLVYWSDKYTLIQLFVKLWAFKANLY